MNPTIQSIKLIRSKLNLQPRAELISYMEKRITELETEKAPIYAIVAGKEALKDLQECDTEEKLLPRLCDWVNASTNDPDPDIRGVYAQIGAFMMCSRP
jgi:hypothetical protein